MAQSAASGHVALDEAIAAAKSDERRLASQRVALLRVFGSGLFLILFVVFGRVGGDPEWRGGDLALAPWFIAAVLLFIAVRNRPEIATRSGLALPLLDVPAVFAVQWLILPGALNPAELVGFDMAVMAILVFASILWLDVRLIALTACAAAVAQGGLQLRAGIDPSILTSTVGVMIVCAFVCTYAARRLSRLVEEVAVRMFAEREASQALQARLLASDRMISMGGLAAGVAHEINNPLAALMGNLDLIARAAATPGSSLAAPGALADVAGEIRDAREVAERIRRIVGDLKVFSRPDEESQQPVDVHRVLDSSLQLAGNEIRHRARLVRHYGKIRHVLANEARLGQVFLNLALNAAQAIQEGHADTNEIGVTTKADSEGRVVIEVRDTGSGMTPDVRSRLFTPFFTTKPVGVGTGLGLSISHRIVTALGGTIEVESDAGRGSVFRVILPSTETEAVQEEAPALAAAPPARRGRVLVIDDEAVVGRMIERLLSRVHEVAVETQATRALERVRRGETFDVILCDLMMPEMTGMDLHAALLHEAPLQAARMVFLSGGAFTPQARAFFDAVPNQRIEKPFELQALIALVNRSVRSADA